MKQHKSYTIAMSDDRRFPRRYWSSSPMTASAISTRWLAPAQILANRGAIVTCASLSRPITEASV
jgi:hypothetical protein